MKIYICALFLLMKNTLVFSQIKESDIIGKWQKDFSAIASGYYFTYTFSKENKFEFKNSELEGLNRVISIGGHYVIQNNALILTEEYVKELVGGIPEISETSGGSGWEIDGGKIVTTKLKNNNKYNLKIQLGQAKDGIKFIEIDSHLFYKVE